MLAVRTIRQLREVEERLLIELPPAEFLFPDRDGLTLFIAAGDCLGALRGTPGLTGTERSHTESSTQVRGSRQAWEIAIRLVGHQGRIHKRRKLLRRRSLARTAWADLRASEAMGSRQLFEFPLPLRTETAEGTLSGVDRHADVAAKVLKIRGSRNGAGLAALNLAAPVAQKGAVHPIGIPGAGLQLLGRHQQLIPVHKDFAAIRLQGLGNGSVTFSGVGLHIPAPHHSRSLQQRGQTGEEHHRITRQHEQATAGPAPGLLQLTQAFKQKPQTRRRHGGQLGRWRQDGRIQHVHTGHGWAKGSSRVQPRVVSQAQVAAMPEQGAGGGHQRKSDRKDRSNKGKTTRRMTDSHTEPQSRRHQRFSNCLARYQAVTLLPSSHSLPEARQASSSDGSMVMTSRSSSSSPAGGLSRRVS